MFLQENNALPEPLLNKYILCTDIHTHNTKQANKLHKQSRRTALVSNSLIERGPDCWNTLPENIREGTTCKLFNKRHKYCLTHAY